RRPLPLVLPPTRAAPWPLQLPCFLPLPFWLSSPKGICVCCCFCLSFFAIPKSPARAKPNLLLPFFAAQIPQKKRSSGTASFITTTKIFIFFVLAGGTIPFIRRYSTSCP